MQTSENLDLTWHLRSPLGKTTNRNLGDALNLIRRNKREKERREAIGKKMDIFKC